jgi:hypothetical protein
VQGQVGQDPAEQGGELEAVGGAEGDQDAVVAGEGAEDEVAVRGEGVEAGGGVVVGADGGGRRARRNPARRSEAAGSGSKPRVVAVTRGPPTSWAALRAVSGQTGKP